MAVDWSESIVVANLEEEPGLSEELGDLSAGLRSAEQTPHVVLDFSGVSFLNSSNIAQLLRLRQAVTERGRRMVLCGLIDQVWSTVIMTGLDKVFTCAPDTITAIASLQLEEQSDEAAAP